MALVESYYRRRNKENRALAVAVVNALSESMNGDGGDVDQEGGYVKGHKVVSAETLLDRIGV